MMPLTLTSRRVVLEPLAFHHLDSLHEIVCQPAMIGSWLFDGTELSVVELSDRLWAVSQLQYAVLRRDSGAVIGLVQGIDADVRSRTIGLGLVVHPALWMHGWPLEGVTLFVHLLFDVMGYRKIYGHVSSSTLGKLGSAVGRALTREATFEQHQPVPGRPGEYESWHILAFYREQWDPQLFELIGGRRDGAAPISPL